MSDNRPPAGITPEMEITTCPLCKSAQRVVFDQRLLHGYHLANHLCQGCGMVYLSPRLSEEQLVGFYAQDYRRLYHGEAEPTPEDLVVQEKRARFLANFILGQTAGPQGHINRHLDIGCSTGTLLQVFARQFGCAPAGVELDDSHRAYARKGGLAVYPSLDELPEAQEKFDLVSLIHVLEHLPDPVGSLVDIRQKRLDRSGWLLLEVPNLYAHDSFEIAHLVSFSRMSLTQTVQQAGFELVAVFSHGQPRSNLLRLYITLLARPAQDGAAKPPISPREAGTLQAPDRPARPAHPRAPLPLSGLAPSPALSTL